MTCGHATTCQGRKRRLDSTWQRILAARQASILAGRRLYDVWGVNEDAEYSEAGTSGERAALASERLVPGRAA